MKLIAFISILSFSYLQPALGFLPDNNLGSTPSQRYVINETQALAVIKAAQIQATNISSPSNIAVTDPSGLLVAFHRMDNALPVCIDIALQKAKTVSLFSGVYTTADLYNLTQPGGSLYGIEETNGGLIVLGGGLPIYVDGYFLGACGVSGGSSDQDVSVATAAVNALGSMAM
ncbi:hypothetical protein MMC28_004135 [Mycoblastus sanguinarius]|nr:hypothetical protein [Mycoblastus sanguinarius]